MAVAGNRRQVDLDEVRRRADGRLGEHRRRRRVWPEVRCPVGCGESGELRDVGCGLTDLERHLGGADERLSQREVSLLRRSRSVAHRHEDMRERGGVGLAESRQAGTQGLRLSRDAGAVGATRPSRVRPS